MSYLFSVKDRQVYLNEQAVGDTKEPSSFGTFGADNFNDGDLYLPATIENISSVADGRLFVNYSKIKDGNQYKDGSGDVFSKDTRYQNVNNPTGGWCWFASGTLHRFFYKDFDLYKAVCKINPDTFHWWLQDKSGNVIDLTEEQYLINGIENIREGIIRKQKSGEIKPFRPLRTSYALKTRNMAYFLVRYFTEFDIPMNRIKVHNYDK